MTDRERNLAIITFAIVGFAAVVLLANKLVFGPANAAKLRVKSLNVQVADLRNDVGLERSYQQKLSDHIARSFGTDRDQASANSREFIMKSLGRSGMKTDDARTTPISGTRLKNKAGYEIGWNVTVVGSLEQITNLLYLLQNDPHLFRIDDVSWIPIDKSTDVTLQFKLVTLVLEPEPRDRKHLPSLAAQIEDFAWFARTNATVQLPVSTKALRSDERKQYAMIEERDIFRPYIKRPPPPPKRPDPPTRTTERTNDPAPPRPARVTYALVGLPQFGADQEVMVKDSKSGKTKTFKIGEDLMGGEIVMIDYRGLPLLKDPEKFSPSRVIVRVGQEYWAVELGDDLDDKYRMNSDRLPSALRQARPLVKPQPKLENKPEDQPEDKPEATPVDQPDSSTKTDTNASDVSTPPDSKLTPNVPPSNDATTSKESDDAS